MKVELTDSEVISLQVLLAIEVTRKADLPKWLQEPDYKSILEKLRLKQNV